MQIYLSKGEKRRFGVTVALMCRSVVPNFSAGRRLHRKQLTAEKSRSRFVTYWSLIEPLLIGGIFVLLYQFRAISALDTGLPYALFVITGVMFWQSLVDAVNQPLGAIQRSRDLLLNTHVQPEALMWCALIRATYNAAFRAIIALAFILYFLEPSPIFVLLGFTYFFVFTWLACGLGFLLEPFNAIAEDVTTAVNLILRPLLFVSGVLFPVVGVAQLEMYIGYNPFLIIVENFRSITFGFPMYEQATLVTIAGTFFMLFLCAWYVFHLSVRLVVEKG